MKKILSTFLVITLMLTSFVNIKAEDRVEKILSEMTIDEKIGQLMQIDFRHWTVDGEQVPFREMNEEVAQVIKDYHLGGVILFRENVNATEQTARLVHGLQKAKFEDEANQVPMFITIDQEGGLVTRLETGTNMPGNMALGAARNLEITEEVAYTIGRELNSLGININFAPVVDVNSNPNNPVIGIRSFGSDPQLVADQGVAYVKGLQRAAVGGSAKHFPGHGDTATDSHYGLPVVDKPREEMLKVDLKPFKAAMDAGIDMIMTAHIVVPSLDDTKIIDKDGNEMGTPATLSKKILTDLVRDEFNYDGVIVTDAMNMKAISDNFTQAESAVRALEAGADIVLMPTFVRSLDGPEGTEQLDAIYSAIKEAINSDDSSLTEERINQSVRRVLKLKESRGILDYDANKDVDEVVENALKVVGSAEHKKIERKAAEQAITLVKNEGHHLPFELKDNQKILLLASWGSRANLMQLRLEQIIEKFDLENVTVEQHVFAPLESLSEEEKEMIQSSDYVIAETYNLSSASKWIPEAIDFANENDIDFTTMSTRNPYDIAYMQNVKSNIAIYGSSGYDQTQEGEASLPINIPVGIDVIFGLVSPTGMLPVNIYDQNDEILYPFGHGLNFILTESLEELMEEIKKTDLADYTEDSVAKLNLALQESEEFMEGIDEIHHQSAVDEVYESLKAAYNALEKKPEVEKPEVEKPEVEKPEVEKPEVEKPEVEKPEVEKPEVEKPEVEKPEVEKPEVEKPEGDLPSTGMAPILGLSGLGISALGVLLFLKEKFNK